MATELRRFRGGMSPTAAEVDTAVSVESVTAVSHPTDLKELLAEVQAIRLAVEAW